MYIKQPRLRTTVNGPVCLLSAMSLSISQLCLSAWVRSDTRGSSRSRSVETQLFFSSRRRHTTSLCDWSSDVCSSDLPSPCHGFALVARRPGGSLSGCISGKNCLKGQVLQSVSHIQPSPSGPAVRCPEYAVAVEDGNAALLLPLCLCTTRHARGASGLFARGGGAGGAIFFQVLSCFCIYIIPDNAIV